MRKVRGLLLAVGAIWCSGCIDASLLLQVSPDGSGHATITTRLYESGLKSFDSLFPDSPKEPIDIEAELPAPMPDQLRFIFGGDVKIASTKLAKAPDGGVRTTVVDFDDVTKIALPFPPIVGLSSGLRLGALSPTDGDSFIRFAMKPHENGDRLLVVRLPSGSVDAQPNPEMTVFKSDSPEERAFKAAIKNSALRFSVELTDTILLRSNAPLMKGNRVTILDLDLDKVINNLDENKVRRALQSGSMQEMMWQVGDMPGAVVPTEHDVFLEFEPPHPAQQPAAAQPAQAPPDTELYLAPLKIAKGAIEVGTPVNISNNPGYDNQPSFTPDGRAILFTSMRAGGAPSATAPPQTDIYRYDIESKRIAQVTNTPESEYSPTVTPAGAISVIRVELDGSKTQRLWQFSLSGSEPRVVLENVKPVGYHAWIDDHALALFVLGQPATLQLADTRTGAARVVASDIGRSIQPIPGSGVAREISFVQREREGEATRLVIKKLNPASGEITVLTPAVAGSTEADLAWTPNGTLLMARNGILYAWSAGSAGWREVANLERMSLRGVTRLAVSPRGDYLALVGLPGAAR